MTESGYFTELCRAMAEIAAIKESMFVGQGVGCAGTTMTDTLRDVPPSKLLEFPVAEDLQMGTCTGMALEGVLPVCVFPRWNFMICAANQIVNHLDRLSTYSNGGYRPRVIIRVATPKTAGFDPGPQHNDDMTAGFRRLLRSIELVTLPTAETIVPEYRRAVERSDSTILVEYTALYGAVPSGVPTR